MAQMDIASVAFNILHPDALRMIERRTDGWNCERVRTDTLNLTDDTLTSSTTYADTVWCDLRAAGEAFDDANYGLAADIYARVLPDFEGQMAQYLHARLTLSLALNHDYDQVRQTLDSIEPSGQMGELLTLLRAVSDQPDSMCRVAYDFFAEYRAQEGQDANPYGWTPPNFHFGFEPQDPRSLPLPVPAQAGCDYRKVMGIDPTPIPSPQGNIPDIHSLASHSAYLHLMREEYEDLLAHLDAVFALPEESNGDFMPQLTYWRAMTLEFMGRPDEALAQYVIIHEAAPDSAWGMLAALHFNVVDSQG